MKDTATILEVRITELATYPGNGVTERSMLRVAFNTLDGLNGIMYFANTISNSAALRKMVNTRCKLTLSED